MLPPGLGFNAISEKALAASRDRAAAALLLGLGADASRPTRPGCFPYTPATNLLFGAARGARPAARGGPGRTSSPATSATPRRRAARCAPGASRSCAIDEREYSELADRGALPDGHDADDVRALILERFDMSLGAGPRPARGPRVPDRPPGRPQRPDARRHAVRRRDGPASWRACRAGGVQAALDHSRVRADAPARPRDRRRERRRLARIADHAARGRLERELEGEVRSDRVHAHLYSPDASMYAIEPLGVVLPARRRRRGRGGRGRAREPACPCWPRGAGTSLAGQTVGRAARARLLAAHAPDRRRSTPGARRARVQPGVVQDAAQPRRGASTG